MPGFSKDPWKRCAKVPWRIYSNACGKALIFVIQPTRGRKWSCCRPRTLGWQSGCWHLGRHLVKLWWYSDINSLLSWRKGMATVMHAEVLIEKGPLQWQQRCCCCHPSLSGLPNSTCLRPPQHIYSLGDGGYESLSNFENDGSKLKGIEKG